MTDQTKSSCGCKPPWLRVRLGHHSQLFQATEGRLRAHNLHTVCEEALCPNKGRCWSNGRATFLILGDRCTRGCTFCNVDKRTVLPPDPTEPSRVVKATKETGLKEVVITSVTRDDLPDGGSALWAETVQRLHDELPEVLVEVLVPDFGGKRADIERVIHSKPDVFGHNLETVPRLYPLVRAEANYQRSLDVLRQASDAGLITKTSLMLGLGETFEEIEGVLRDARQAGCEIFYAGQYLQPSARHQPVLRYVTPEEFDQIGKRAVELGFAFVASAPLVRSSYHEEGQSAFVRSKRA